MTLADASKKLEVWHRYHNEERSHGEIGYNAPIKLANPDSETGQLPR
jgi:hypothetical protein